MLPISHAIVTWSVEIGQNVMLIYYLRTINLSIAFRRLKHHMAHKIFRQFKMAAMFITKSTCAGIIKLNCIVTMPSLVVGSKRCYR